MEWLSDHIGFRYALNMLDYSFFRNAFINSNWAAVRSAYGMSRRVTQKADKIYVDYIFYLGCLILFSHFPLAALV